MKKELPEEILDLLNNAILKVRAGHVEINTICPYCKENLNGTVTGDGGIKPVPGAVSLCMHCVNIIQFDENLQFIKFTPESWQALG